MNDRQLSMAEAIKEVIRREMQRDSSWSFLEFARTKFDERMENYADRNIK
jgi:hypothetical protein